MPIAVQVVFDAADPPRLAHVATLVEAGATIAYRLEEDRGHAVVMRDPEGNEFCVQ